MLVRIRVTEGPQLGGGRVELSGILRNKGREGGYDKNARSSLYWKRGRGERTREDRWRVPRKKGADLARKNGVRSNRLKV